LKACALVVVREDGTISQAAPPHVDLRVVDMRNYGRRKRLPRGTGFAELAKEIGYSERSPLPEPRLECCAFAPVSALVPSAFAGWSDADAPFSWGGNNRTLVTVERFAKHIRDRYEAELAYAGDDAEPLAPDGVPSDADPEDPELLARWAAWLDTLPPGLYVDLEN
jgi:hypothetical protein